MKMLLIDGNSVLFRAYYATSHNMMKTSDGVYTNAVFAFANMFNKALSLIHPEYCVVAFDKGKHNFRHELDPEYKANRKPAPVELAPQFKLVREFLSAYHVPYLEYDDVEGDDIIGSIAKKYPSVDVCILTSDKDILQLLDRSTHVYFMRQGLSDIDIIDDENLKDIWPVRPEQIPDLKGLMGDKSDNIKGVDGIGKVGAIKLLSSYDSVKDIYDHIDDVDPKLRKKLVADKDAAFLSRELAVIKTDIDIDVKLEDLKLALDDFGVNEFYKKYEMRSMIKKLDVKGSSEVKAIRTDKISDGLLDDDTLIFIDTDGFKYYNARIYGMTFAKGDKIEYIPYEDLLNDEKAIKYLASDKHKIFFDLKFTKHIFKDNGLVLGDNNDDIYLMAFLLNNLNDSLESILASNGIIIETLTDIYGTPKKPKAIDSIAQTKRASTIAGFLAEKYQDITTGLKKDDLYKLYTEVELPLVDVLFAMENEGIICDQKVLDEIGSELKVRIDTKKQAIFDTVGHEFNVNSPAQLATVLFDELGLPANKKRSTNVEELEKLELYHPVIRQIMEYRKDNKLYTTYIEGLSKYIDEKKKIHTIFSQTMTQTGRLSSSEPNLQNITVRDEDGKMIRKAFKGVNGHYLLSSDYSQIELRVLSSLADEEKMKHAFNNDIDIHTKTAMDIFHLEHDEVDSMHRRKAKAINFGVIYGISDFGLAKQAGVSVMEAKDFISDYFMTYPNIKAFLDEAIKECEENGYVTTILGRRRYIPEIRSKDHRLHEFAKRAAMNSKVQGSAADLIKVAMVNIARMVKEKGLKSKMVLQIHDELIFDVPEDELEVMQELVHDGMVSAMDLHVKLDVSMSYGHSWYEAK